MTAAVLDRPISLTADRDADGGMTLEELLNAAFQAARINGSTDCPVCHARMTFTRAGEGCPGEALVAECAGCGSRLS